MQPFRNADIPPLQTLESYGIEKDSSKVEDLLAHPNYINMFLRHALKFNLQINMLGECSTYHESLCYREKSINSPKAVSIASLLGNLVDSAKGGFRFDKRKWYNYLDKIELPHTLLKPAYKDKQKGKPSDHLIDHLVFVVAKGVRVMALSKFDKHFTDISPRDDDLFRMRNEAYEEAKSNKPLEQVLKNLGKQLQDIHTFWRINAVPEDAEEELRPRKPNALTFRALVERCRADFVILKPTLDNSPPTETSDRITHWQLNHACGRPSDWDLLKASVAFQLYYPTSFIWHMAGVELGEIKATARGRGNYRVVVGDVFEAFKLNRKVVDGSVRRRELLRGEDVQPVQDGDDDEFGVWDWGVDDC